MALPPNAIEATAWSGRHLKVNSGAVIDANSRDQTELKSVGLTEEIIASSIDPSRRLRKSTFSDASVMLLTYGSKSNGHAYLNDALVKRTAQQFTYRVAERSRVGLRGVRSKPGGENGLHRHAFDEHLVMVQ